MENQFRLKSSSMFERVEEDSELPRRVIILSVEGNKTEQDYFKYIEKYREQLGIKACVHVHPLKRAHHDNKSAPQDVLELLEEYMELRKSEILPAKMREVIPDKYSDEFIKMYLENSDKIGKKERKNFEVLLEKAGIDIQYDKYLKEIRGEGDVFGVVIDRDYGTHSVEQLQSIAKECKQNNYYCFITTPLIEFWLLMHVADVKKQYPDNLDDFLINNSCTTKHTFTSKKLSQIAGHGKAINEKVFCKYYLHNVDRAIKQVQDDFTTDIDELIGTDDNEVTKRGNLGSNLPILFELMREC